MGFSGVLVTRYSRTETGGLLNKHQVRVLPTHPHILSCPGHRHQPHFCAGLRRPTLFNFNVLTDRKNID